MEITRQDVIHTAKLARLELTEEEIVRFGKELTQITDYVAQLRQAVAGETETRSAHAPVRVSDRANLRNDEVHPDSVGEIVLENAPDSDGRFFRVPKVID
jgi:aspartyl-tRNA(Asn)/glutamyl-tRNA(Gln) amidotransferase subunit C